MFDVHTSSVRSYNMSQIKCKDTKPELMVRRFLHSRGMRYRVHSKDLPGKPDLILKKYHTVVFIHGCFWHGHEGCNYFTIPKTNTEWWLTKISQNKHRDQKSIKKLESSGWKVIIIWECELREPLRMRTLNQLLDEISSRAVS